MTAPRSVLLRWSAPLLAGFSFLVFLVGELWLRFVTSKAGLINTVAQSFNVGPPRRYALQFALKILLPTYLIAALLLWAGTLAWLSLWKRKWSDEWTFKEGFLLTASALLWTHLLLWWEVPATLWTLPGIRALPFWLGFLLLAAFALAYPLRWLLTRLGTGWKTGLALPVLLAGWSVLPLLPRSMPRWLAPAPGGEAKAQFLIVGLDGLRSDTGLASTRAWQGQPYENVYTPIPATRLLWHILWGGDPLYYTVGHAPPAMEEFEGMENRVSIPLAEMAKAKGWAPRFYIDDGGTIGLAGRAEAFDDILMPARGWENFVNSNLAVNFPLYAAWENWARAFPTTNPWAPLDAGLKEALRQGRGSKWVMFHSCLAHQPIYLRRSELATLPHWWTAIPNRMEPIPVAQLATPERLAKWDPRGNPFLAYEIRMRSILDAWRPVWNGLAQDPDYGQAVRILFSDHGERFYHVTDQVQLHGIHGYNLDPWETRAMLRIAGPGFGESLEQEPSKATISLLSMRDLIAAPIVKGHPLTREAFEQAYPEAPMRYHVLSVADFTSEPGEYKQTDIKGIAEGTYLAPDGIWFMRYTKTAEERAKEVSVGWGKGEELWVIKPLKKGGAHRFHYVGYRLNDFLEIKEEEYLAEKARVESMMKPLDLGASAPAAPRR